MRLIVYGTLRRGESLSHFLPKGGKREMMKISGLQLYVLGACPGAKLDAEGKAIVELWELNLSKKEERSLLRMLDQMEGVYKGLYERNYINTPKGKTLVYTVCGNVRGCPQIRDWKEWQRKNDKEKVRILTKSGGIKIEIRRSTDIWM